MSTTKNFCQRQAPLYTIDKMSKLDLPSGVTARGQSAPQHFSPGNFCWPTSKREAWKKGKMEKKRRKIERGRWKIENWRRKSYKWGEDLFLLFTFPKMGTFYREKNQEKLLCPLWKIFLLRPWIYHTMYFKVK